jgi:hypothetical protein
MGRKEKHHVSEIARLERKLENKEKRRRKK